MARRLATRCVRLIPVLMCAALAASCGGDATTGVDIPPPTPSGPTVSGTVLAPNGQLSQLPNSLLEHFAALVVDVANALSANVSPVARTTVTLQQVGGQPLHTTQSGDQGGYKFVLDPGQNEGACPPLQVSVGSGSTMMRALVCSTSAPTDIDSVSNAVASLIIAAGNICTFTPTEVCNLVSIARQIPDTLTCVNVAQCNADAIAVIGSNPAWMAAFNLARGTPVPNTPTDTPAPTATFTAATPVSSATPSNTLTRVPTSTPTPTTPVANTPTRSPTSGATHTNTPAPTNTVPPATNTPSVPTATFTNPPLPTATNTPAPTNTSPPATLTPTATGGPTPPQGAATLPSGISATATTIPISDLTGFPNMGKVLIGGEVISYNGTSSSGASASSGGAAAVQPGSLLNAQRGANGTTAQSHPAGSVVSLIASTGSSVNVGNAVGSPGAAVSITTTLIAGGAQIQATSNDIKYDSTQVEVGLLGDGTTPDCTVNSTIGPTTGPGKHLLLSVLPGSGSQKTLRVGVISFDNVVVIPDGALFTCTFKIAANATLGIATLTNVPGAADPVGSEPAVTGTTGAITVQAAGAAVNVGSASGAKGATVPVPVSLANSAGQIQATSNDIQYDSTQVNVALKGDNVTPDCTVSATNKMALLSVLPASGSGKILRVGVINFNNVDPIADGPVFSCNFKIEAGATSGAKALANVPGAANAAGTDLSVGGAAGSITVQ